MKHLRIALEGIEASGELVDVAGMLNDHINNLADITNGMPDTDDALSSVSMESFVRYKPGSSIKIAAFQVAIEELSGTAWAAIAAGIAALIALLIKAFKHFTGDKNDGAISKAIVSHEKAKEDSAKMAEYIAISERIIEGADEIALELEKGQLKPIRSLQDIIDSTPSLLDRFEQLMDKHVAFLYGPASENAFVKALKEQHGFESELTKAVELGTRDFDRVVDLLLRDIDPHNERELQAYADNIDKAQSITVIKQFHLHGKDTNIHDLAKVFQDALAESATLRPGTHTSFSEVHNNLEGYFKNDLSYEVLQKLDGNMKAIKVASSGLQEAEGLSKMVDRDKKRWENLDETPENKHWLSTIKKGSGMLLKALTEQAAQLRASISITNTVVKFSSHLVQTEMEVHELAKQAAGELKKHGKNVPDDVLEQIAKFT